MPQPKPFKSATPPAAVAKEAKRGLELRKQHKRGGTEIGVWRAENLVKRTPLDLPELKRIRSYFARHEVDKRGKDWNNKERPSAGRIAWLLWGGEPGRKWVERELKKAVSRRA
jgi:hypothetical protein